MKHIKSHHNATVDIMLVLLFSPIARLLPNLLGVIYLLGLAYYLWICLSHPDIEIATNISDAEYQHKLKIVKEKEHKFASGWYYVCTSDRVSF